MSAGKYSALKFQAIGDPDLSLDNIQSTMKTIFVNHSERSSVTKRSQESNSKGCGGGREFAMSAVVTYPHYKTTGQKIKDNKRLTEKSGLAKSGKLENGGNKSCKYHYSNLHSNDDCYQQRSDFLAN